MFSFDRYIDRYCPNIDGVPRSYTVNYRSKQEWTSLIQKTYLILQHIFSNCVTFSRIAFADIANISTTSVLYFLDFLQKTSILIHVIADKMANNHLKWLLMVIICIQGFHGKVTCLEMVLYYPSRTIAKIYYNSIFHDQ